MRTRALLVALAMALAACGGDGDGDDSSSASAPLEATEPAAPETATDDTVTDGGALPSEAPVPPDGVTNRPPEFEVVVEMDEPIDLRQRPGTDTLYVASRQGTIHAIDGDELDDDALLDISDDTDASGEQGLLGFTFSPDGALVYVHYTDRQGTSTVAEYVVDGDRADPDTRRVLLIQQQPFPNHNGGSITFGPDGLLYLGLGDGGSGGDPQGNGQALDTWLGKLLRIDPVTDGDAPYAIPADNPFAAGGGRPEIYAWGLRNPWRFSFDRVTGDLWVGDVGQNEVEEINRSTTAEGAGKGANYGWRRFEGDALFDEGTEAPGAVAPVYTATHSGDGACSITGGFVYRGQALPALQGAYLFSDLCWTGVRAWLPETGAVDLGGGMGRIVSFAEDLDGELYVLSFDGAVYRMV